MPEVSIILPNYNHARFLEERLDSIFLQTFQDFELLILDDASTDGSREILSRYKDDPRVRLIFNETNSGSSFKQWNLGAQEAKGEYLWIAESDDRSSPFFLQEMLECLRPNKSAVLAYCQSLILNEGGEFGELFNPDIRLIPYETKDKRWSNSFSGEGKSEIKSWLSRRNTIPNASSVLIRRNAYLTSGGADERFQLCGDWDFWIRLLSQGDLIYLAKPLNHWRTHHKSVRKTTNRVKAAGEFVGIIQNAHRKNFSNLIHKPYFLETYMRILIGIAKNQKGGGRESLKLGFQLLQVDIRFLNYLPLVLMKIYGRHAREVIRRWLEVAIGFFGYLLTPLKVIRSLLGMMLKTRYEENI